MRKLAHVLAAVALLAATSLGGDCPAGGACCNQCPLAQEAVHHYSSGTEAYTVSRTVRADFVDSVLANLRAI